jgi:hypothetical protein
MALLAEFFVAPPAYALEWTKLVQLGGAILTDDFERARYKNFTPIALGMLWAILRSEKWDVNRRALEHVCRAENGETWLLRFPDELTDLISLLDETAINRVADGWAHPREVPGTSDELKPVLRDLKRLAAQARKNAGTLYLWGSL